MSADKTLDRCSGNTPGPVHKRRSRKQQRPDPAPPSPDEDPSQNPPYGPVILWNDYLSQEAQDALLTVYSLESGGAGEETFWRWEESRSLQERLRIYHFRWTYDSYTEPECPLFRVWLTEHEIRARVFRSAVPPFTGGEYESTKQFAIEMWAAHPYEIGSLVAKENSMLLQSQRWWTVQEFALVQLYRSLPYDIDQRELHGRWVEPYIGPSADPPSFPR